MFGINFIGPDLNSLTGERANEISCLPGLPRPYGKDNLISEHLINACFFVALELSAQQHVNPVSGEVFSCVSYYSNDQQDSAMCSTEDFGFLATMSMPFVRRLVKISNRLTPALNLRPRVSSNPKPKKTQRMIREDQELNALLEGNVQVSESEALGIVSHWPSAKENAQIELGEYALFYDMIQLIWVHEWAHALCGHVVFAKTNLGISRLHEFSAERADVSSTLDDSLRYRRNEILQAIEAHADQFALRHCIAGILSGHDPIASIAGPRIDLADRLLIFNVACCVFAIVWALAERKYSPDDTFFPPTEKSTSDTPAPPFVITRSTHPPAVLRYDHFRGFQRGITALYGFNNGHPQLGPMVDAYSFNFLETLGEISRYFFSLQAVTPMLFRTPTQKTLEAYSTHLMQVGVSLVPKIEQLYYLPTTDPHSAKNKP